MTIGIIICIDDFFMIVNDDYYHHKFTMIVTVISTYDIFMFSKCNCYYHQYLQGLSHRRDNETTLLNWFISVISKLKCFQNRNAFKTKLKCEKH